jgi:hypothetical protein
MAQEPDASFQATLAPWRAQSGDLAPRVSFGGVATIGIKGDVNGLGSPLIEPLMLCDEANNFRAEFRPTGAGSVNATVKVGSSLPFLATIPVQIGGARPTTGNYLWIEPGPAGVEGVAHVTTDMVFYYAPAGQGTKEYRGPVVFETRFRAAAWQERIRQGAGTVANFEKMTPHQRLPVIRWAGCGTTPPNPPAPLGPSTAQTEGVAANKELADRWFARCQAEWTSAQGPREPYLTKCRCAADVLAGARTYLRPDELAGLSTAYTQTLARVMARGRRPAVYVTQAGCTK